MSTEGCHILFILRERVAGVKPADGPASALPHRPPPRGGQTPAPPFSVVREARRPLE